MEDKVIDFLRSRGPSLPSDVAKSLKMDTFFAGAHLSTLVESNKASVSNLKIGSSPLYFLKDHRPRLEQFARFLGEKDKKTFDLLKEKKVLKDRSLDALTRVSLRGIKDFAVQLNVTVAGNKEVFWKFYSVGDEEVNSLIKAILESEGSFSAPKKELPKSQVVAPVAEVKGEGSGVKAEPVKGVPYSAGGVEGEDLSVTINHQVDVHVDGSHAGLHSFVHEGSAKRHVVEDKVVKKKAVVPEQQVAVQETLVKDEPVLLNGEFYGSVVEDFKKRLIKVQSAEMVKKGKEYDFVLSIPSPAGDLTYYCRAKDKKRVNEGDLSSVVLKAQSRRLPAVFLTNGELTKKAEKVLNEELKDQINIMRLGELAGLEDGNKL